MIEKYAVSIYSNFLILFLILSASAESQTLKSISVKDTSITSEHEFKRMFGWNIKAGSGIYHFADEIYEINGEMEYVKRK